MKFLNIQHYRNLCKLKNNCIRICDNLPFTCQSFQTAMLLVPWVLEAGQAPDRGSHIVRCSGQAPRPVASQAQNCHRRTNGEELGDPTCVWEHDHSSTQVPTGITHPGMKDGVEGAVPCTPSPFPFGAFWLRCMLKHGSALSRFHVNSVQIGCAHRSALRGFPLKHFVT